MSAPLLPTLLRSLRPHLQKPLISPLTRTIFPSRLLPSTSRTFTSTSNQRSINTTKMASTTSFLDAVANRRSIYALNKTSPISDDRIEEIVTQLVKNVPSSFNSQSARLVLLLKDEHDKFWDVVRDVLKAIVPESAWEHTGARIEGFRAGYGTILFYEDPAPVKNLQSKFAQYADKFPDWSEHTSAMHQYAAWTALEAEGLGANLQHYNPLPDQKASEIWNIPLEWSLKAQLVFGGVQEGAREKLPTRAEEKIAGGRLFVHGKSA